MDYPQFLRVRVRGLQGRPELNGCVGVVLGQFDGGKQRWPVRVHVHSGDATSTVEVMLRHENLEAEGRESILNSIAFPDLEAQLAGTGNVATAMATAMNASGPAAAQSPAPQLSAHTPAAAPPATKTRHAVTVAPPSNSQPQSSKRKFIVQGGAQEGSEQLDRECSHAGYWRHMPPPPPLVSAFNRISAVCMRTWNPEKHQAQAQAQDGMLNSIFELAGACEAEWLEPGCLDLLQLDDVPRVLLSMAVEALVHETGFEDQAVVHVVHHIITREYSLRPPPKAAATAPLEIGTQVVLVGLTNGNYTDLNGRTGVRPPPAPRPTLTRLPQGSSLQPWTRTRSAGASSSARLAAASPTCRLKTWPSTPHDRCARTT
jgi:hypothetical protein